METLDDVDENEAFINDLMAMHPNDDDIVVEDLEEVDEHAATEVGTIREPDDVVRMHCEKTVLSLFAVAAFGRFYFPSSYSQQFFSFSFFTILFYFFFFHTFYRLFI